MQDLTGRVFGRLTALSCEGRTSNTSHHIWTCECACGELKRVRQDHLLSGATASCGCKRREWRGAETHGMCYHPLYVVHRSMVQRCVNKNNHAFKNYGGRGITVCDEWLDFTSFFKWAESKWFKGSNLDRIDNEKGYSPENCRFVTPELNRHNQRPKQNSTGYTGIMLRNTGFGARIASNRPPCSGYYFYLGTFPTKEEAIKARNEFIIKYNLPHKIQEYKGD